MDMSTCSPHPDVRVPASTRAIRDAADAYVRRLAELDPAVGAELGLTAGADRLPDLSPAGRVALDELSRSTLAELDALERPAGHAETLPGDDRRCGRLLRERLNASLALSADAEYLRRLMNMFGLQQRTRGLFLLMPASTADDWATVARRMSAMPAALAGYRQSLAEAAQRGQFVAAPRQVQAVAGQLDAWLADAGGRGWFAGFCADAVVASSLRRELDAAAATASAAAADLRDWLRAEYLSRSAGTPDGVGADHYRLWARYWTGAALDLAETYDWGWSQYRDLRAQVRAQADRVLPGSTAIEAMRHLDEHGEVIGGAREIRHRLQQVLDEAIRDLDGAHFDIAGPVKVVEARIAPSGSAAAPYYTRPSRDFTRPGRTWLPTMGRTRFPMWGLLSAWYHEGVPGHHLQLGHWMHLAGRLSVFQTSIGEVDACTEGWALYAERLMDEFGYFRSPGDRLGFLNWQLMRAIRVIIDIGLHLRLPIPADSPVGAGRKWTPELAREFFGAHNGSPPEFQDSEIVRYLGLPGQAICYKVGERAWLAARDTARAAHAARGDSFSLKSWHMAALSAGSLGLDDLADELGRL